MAIIKRSPTRVGREDLVSELVSEIKATENLTSATIIEEPSDTGDRFSVTVIWEKWDGVDIEERSPVVMSAYKQARPDDVLKIAFILALTPTEADKLGVTIH